MFCFLVASMPLLITLSSIIVLIWITSSPDILFDLLPMKRAQSVPGWTSLLVLRLGTTINAYVTDT
jgi:hypothetical protein